jgi:hypothetical protein
MNTNRKKELQKTHIKFTHSNSQQYLELCPESTRLESKRLKAVMPENIAVLPNSVTQELKTENK